MGRPKKTNSDLSCPSCNSRWIVRNGKSKEIQRFLCKMCNLTFCLCPKIIHSSQEKKSTAIKMYMEGKSLREIGRELNVSHHSVFTWIKKKKYNKSELQLHI